MPDDDFDPCACDPRHLTLRQWTALRKFIVARAQADRTRLIGHMVIGGLRALWTAWRRMRLRREARIALASMSDRELRDIGVSRSWIDVAVRRRNVDPLDDWARHHYGAPAPTAGSCSGSDSPECRWTGPRQG